MEEKIKNCNDVVELNALITKGLDKRLYNLILERLLDLVGVEETIATTTDIDLLKTIIDDDNGRTNKSKLALRRISQLSGRDDVDPVPRNMEGGDHPASVMDEPAALTANDQGQKRPASDDDDTAEPSASEAFDVSNHYEFQTMSTKHVKKYQATATDYPNDFRRFDYIVGRHRRRFTETRR